MPISKLSRRDILESTLLLPAIYSRSAAPGLNARAAPKGLFYGCAVSAPALTNDRILRDHVALEAGMIVAEYAFKWAALHPTPSRYDWSQSDALVAFASDHGLRVRGHTLAWHASNPDWLAGALTSPATAEGILRQHITAVAGRYRGRIAQWDVVNEPLRPEDGEVFDLRRHPWFSSLGPAYLDVAFDACKKADPTALRVLNEFGLEYAIPWQQKRRDSLLDLLHNLTSRKVPIDALGMQAHLDGAETAFDPAILLRFLDEVSHLGLKVVVTELDVRDSGLPSDIDVRDHMVAACTGEYLRTVLSHEATLGVMTWGISDKGTWLNQAFPRADGLPQRPLPLNDLYLRKPMWQIIAQLFDALPRKR